MNHRAKTNADTLAAETVLIEAGIHPTAVRIIVWRQIVQCNHAFTLAEMESQLETIEKSTLFRTLTLFLQHQLLHEVDNGSGSKLYCRCICSSQQHFAHIHFTCTQCGQTFCIRDINGSQIPLPRNFEVKEINCVMKGLCPDCKSKIHKQ